MIIAYELLEDAGHGFLTGSACQDKVYLIRISIISSRVTCYHCVAKK